MDSKIIKSHQCFVERSHVVLKLILNSDQALALFKQKQILTDLLVTNIYKKNEDFFIQLLYAWLHLANNNFTTFISIEDILDQPIFLNPRTRMDFKYPIQDYFRQIYHYQGSLQISTTRSSLLFNISQEFYQKIQNITYNHTKYINLLLAQFPMTVNTYLELKLPKNSFCIFSARTIKSHQKSKRLPKTL